MRVTAESTRCSSSASARLARRARSAPRRCACAGRSPADRSAASIASGSRDRAVVRAAPLARLVVGARRRLVGSLGSAPVPLPAARLAVAPRSRSAPITTTSPCAAGRGSTVPSRRAPEGAPPTAAGDLGRRAAGHEPSPRGGMSPGSSAWNRFGRDASSSCAFSASRSSRTRRELAPGGDPAEREAEHEPGRDAHHQLERHPASVCRPGALRSSHAARKPPTSVERSAR